MEILKRAKGKTDGEVVSFAENAESVREEADRRVRKAGYARGRTTISAGWSRKFEENFKRIRKE